MAIFAPKQEQYFYQRFHMQGEAILECDMIINIQPLWLAIMSFFDIAGFVLYPTGAMPWWKNLMRSRSQIISKLVISYSMATKSEKDWLDVMRSQVNISFQFC